MAAARMIHNYWAVQFTDTANSYIWIAWDSRVKERELPPALGFRMILFNTRKAARAWVKAKNAEMFYWTSKKNYLRVARVRVTVAPPPRIKGKLV